MRPIIYNSNNLVDSQFQNQFTYTFPSGGVRFKDNRIALAELTLYNSFYNITSATTFSRYNNDLFRYVWIDSTVVDVLIPDGYYSFDDINAYLQSVMTANDHYLLNSSGAQVFYLQLQVSANVYAVQLNAFAVPDTLPVGWTLPSGASWTLPVSPTTPQIEILPTTTNNFYKVVGFTPGNYPPAPQSTDYSVLSDIAPQITPVQSIYLTCNMVNNDLSIPNNFVYAFTTGNTKLGELISIKPPDFLYSPMYNASTSSITINFLDQNLNPIFLIDPNIVVILVVEDK
jgi:hypothetical protein